MARVTACSEVLTSDTACEEAAGVGTEGRRSVWSRGTVVATGRDPCVGGLLPLAALFLPFPRSGLARFWVPRCVALQNVLAQGHLKPTF